MASVKLIREGIAANLESLKGCQVSAYMLENPTPPTVWVFPGDEDYDLAARRGTDKLTFMVQAIAGIVTDQGAQQLLDEFMDDGGAKSIKAAVESDTTLGGAADDLHVTERSGYQQVTLEGRGRFVFAEWTVEVYAAGTA